MSKRYRAQRKKARTASPVIRELFRVMQERELGIIDVAEELGISCPALSYWKSGRSDPSITSVEALAQVLGYQIRAMPTYETVKEHTCGKKIKPARGSVQVRSDAS